MKNSKQHLQWYIFAFVTLFFAFYLYKEKGFSDIGKTFSSLKVIFLVLAICSQATSRIISAFITHYLRLKYQKIGYLFTLHSQYFGLSIGALLPGFLSAGSVSEISIMRLQGLDVHKSGSIFLTRLVAYFLLIAIVPTIAIFTNLNYFRTNISSEYWWLYLLFSIGFIINIATVFFYAFIARANKTLYKIALFFVKLLAKLRIFKNPDLICIKIKAALNSLKNQMSNLPFTAFDWFFIIMLFSINYVIGNLTSYLCALSLGIEIHGTLWNMVACSAFITAISSTLPVPSGLGIADIAYRSLMWPLVGKDNITYLHLLWRMITFYLPILISMIVMLFPIPRNKEIEGNR